MANCIFQDGSHPICSSAKWPFHPSHQEVESISLPPESGLALWLPWPIKYGSALNWSGTFQVLPLRSSYRGRIQPSWDHHTVRSLSHVERSWNLRCHTDRERSQSAPDIWVRTPLWKWSFQPQLPRLSPHEYEWISQLSPSRIPGPQVCEQNKMIVLNH